MSNFRRGALPIAIAALISSPLSHADGYSGGFADFTPLASSAGPTNYEGKPITFGNPSFQQVTIASVNGQLDDNEATSTDWDMQTLNETGAKKGRFLFTVFESATSGVQRIDLMTGETDTIWKVLPGDTVARFDPATWTPWGTVITGEENWGCGDNVCGRLFELKNPLTAPAIYEPVDATSNDGAEMVHQNIIPRTSHEGMQFDREGNLYLVDELNGGCLLKYTPAAPMYAVLLGRADYFAAGQTSVLRVGDGNTANATGAYEWVPLTDRRGAPLAGAIMATDANGVTSLDSRNTANLPQFKCTDYQRPEDSQIQTTRGRQYLYVTTTTTNEVYRLDLQAKTIGVFANRNSIDLATGTAVGSAFASPDNLAADNDGNIYIVEDRNGGSDDDIWFARDLNKDGDLLDAGEGVARWASNGTLGSEFSGLYFDPFDDNRAWVNIQHPASDNDRTIEITIKGRGWDRDDRDHDGGHWWRW
jgi:hypothetical protein